jgi:hypothetical protein
MIKALQELIKLLDDPRVGTSSVISWAAPVPSFGAIDTAEVATLGLNPSNREFVGKDDRELEGAERRFHTLKSLKLSRWNQIEERHLDLIEESCRDYFRRNPYETWFGELESLLEGIDASYYGSSLLKATRHACHLDLIPFATECKWVDLSPKERAQLLDVSKDSLGLLMKNSKVNTLVLNGTTVIENLQKICGIELGRSLMADWTLPRKSGLGVPGFAYSGVISNIGGVPLGREVRVLGFNHNIQSSHGVTTKVKVAIRNWLEANRETKLP